jgi:hypothetical protein
VVLQPLLGQDWRELAGFYRIPDKEVRQPRDALSQHDERRAARA